MRMSRKLWAAVVALGVVVIPIGVVWMIYAIAQTESATRGTSGSDTVWPIVAFFVAFIGGILITVGSIGFMFRWMSGDDDDNELRASSSNTLGYAVPKTRVGWGGEATDGSPG
jgi:zinc transporter ZupT